MTTVPIQIGERFLYRDADKCVQCGLCLPHCPTYRKTGNENESPRGRIALMRALACGDLGLTPRLESHLDLCLTCRRCEAVCPAQVPYGRLIDSARAVVAASRPRPWRQRLAWRAAGALLTRPRRLTAMAGWLYWYQRSGVQRVVRALGVLRWSHAQHLEAQLPGVARPTTHRSYYPATAPVRGEVALFLGCVARALDAATIDAAIHVLRHFGYAVRIPPGQACCGAIHQHAGQSTGASALITQNLAAFDESNVPVVSLASGCGAMLQEYGAYSSDSRAPPFSARVRDFSQWLSEQPWAPPEITVDVGVVAVHDPCTLSNVMQCAAGPYQLLQRLPGIDVHTLSGNDACCGAAGTYFVTQPDMSGQLLADKIHAIRDSATRTLLTSNIGCALHLRSGIEQHGLDVEVMHPAVLISRLLTNRQRRDDAEV